MHRVFLLSCLFLTTTYDTTFAFGKSRSNVFLQFSGSVLANCSHTDRPVCSLVFACFIAGSTLAILGRFVQHIPRASSPQQKYSVIPLTELGETSSRYSPASPVDHLDEPHSPKSRNLNWWKKVALISAIACIRVEFYRQITLNIECARAGYSYAIPLLVSLYDYWRNQRSQNVEKSFVADSPPNSKLRILITIYKRAYSKISQSRLRYVISAAFLFAGGLITSRFGDGKESTYICPIVSGLGPRLHIFQVLDVLLDSLILIGAAELSHDTRSQDTRKQTLLSWGYGLLVRIPTLYIQDKLSNLLLSGSRCILGNHRGHHSKAHHRSWSQWLNRCSVPAKCVRAKCAGNIALVICFTDGTAHVLFVRCLNANYPRSVIMVSLAFVCWLVSSPFISHGSQSCSTDNSLFP